MTLANTLQCRLDAQSKYQKNLLYNLEIYELPNIFLDAHYILHEAQQS